MVKILNLKFSTFLYFKNLYIFKNQQLFSVFCDSFLNFKHSLKRLKKYKISKSNRFLKKSRLFFFFKSYFKRKNFISAYFKKTSPITDIY